MCVSGDSFGRRGGFLLRSGNRDEHLNYPVAGAAVPNALLEAGVHLCVRLRVGDIKGIVGVDEDAWASQGRGDTPAPSSAADARSRARPGQKPARPSCPPGAQASIPASRRASATRLATARARHARRDESPPRPGATNPRRPRIAEIPIEREPLDLELRLQTSSELKTVVARVGDEYARSARVPHRGIQ